MCEPSDLYAIDDDCATGQCDAEIMFLPQVLGDVELDQKFAGLEVDNECDLDLANVDTAIWSDEMFPPIMDGAIITRDGLLDSFARHYPERAQFLVHLLTKENYEFEFVSAPSTEDLRLRRELDIDGGYIRQLRFERRREAPFPFNLFFLNRSSVWGAPLPNPMKPDAVGDLERIEARYEANFERLKAIRYWQIKDRKITTTSRINRNIDVTNWDLSDDAEHIREDVTNREGADWLNEIMGDWMARSGIPGADPSEEFQDSFNSRVTWGSLNVVLGAAEVVGGVATMVETGWTGAGLVAGGAMTVAGFETISQGVNMLHVPVESSHSRGLLGDAGFALLTKFGALDETDQQVFNRYWAFTMLGLSLGGAGVTTMLPKVTGAMQVASGGTRVSYVGMAMDRGVDAVRLSIVGIKNAKVGKLVMSFAALPSGRILFRIKGGITFVAQRFESLPRLLLRAATADEALTLQRTRKLKASEAGIVSFREGAARLARKVRRVAVPRAFRNEENCRRLVLEVSARMGIDPTEFSRMVQRVEVGAPGQSSSYNGATQVMTIARDVGKSRFLKYEITYNEFIAMNEVAHEINHAIRVQRWVDRGGSLEDYARLMGNGEPPTLGYLLEEVRVERAARAAIVDIVQPRIDHLIASGAQVEADKLSGLLMDAGRASEAYVHQQRRHLISHHNYTLP